MTATMRNYGLVLPKNYVSIEKDEMEYIDGGSSFESYIDRCCTYNSWTGKVTDLYVNSEGAKHIANYAGGLYGLIGTACIGAPPAAATFWAMSIGVSGYINWCNADDKGIIVRIRYIGNTNIFLNYYILDRS